MAAPEMTAAEEAVTEVSATIEEAAKGAAATEVAATAMTAFFWFAHKVG